MVFTRLFDLDFKQALFTPAERIPENLGLSSRELSALSTAGLGDRALPRLVAVAAQRADPLLERRLVQLANPLRQELTNKFEFSLRRVFRNSVQERWHQV